MIIFFLITKKRFNKLITEQFYFFATSVSVFSSIGSLIYSEVVGFIPCKFCWYQRYFMYPIALILLIGLFKKSVIKFAYVSFVGFCLIYHIYLQNGGGSGGSCAIDVPRNLKYVDTFGL